MAYDVSQADGAWVQERAADDWLRSERLVALGGAIALGFIVGLGATLMVGRIDPIVLIAISAPILLLSLYLTAQTLTEAFERRAYGCATAAIAHGVALFAWPVGALMSASTPALFWIGPALALSSLALFASCWSGGARPIYRMALQATLIASITAYQGMFMLMGA